MSGFASPSPQHATSGDHLPITGGHEHDHVHHTAHGRMRHSHPHKHYADGDHIAADPNHLHLEEDLASLEPARKKGRTVIRRRAAGQMTDRLAAAYRAAGDDVLISLSHIDDGPLYLTPEPDDPWDDPGEMSLTVPSAIDGRPVELMSPADVEGAEAELCAMALAADPLGQDTVDGEIFRYSRMHAADQLRSMGHRVPEGF